MTTIRSPWPARAAASLAELQAGAEAISGSRLEAALTGGALLVAVRTQSRPSAFAR